MIIIWRRYKYVSRNVHLCNTINDKYFLSSDCVDNISYFLRKIKIYDFLSAFNIISGFFSTHSIY